jgi:hypothetical protein
MKKKSTHASCKGKPAHAAASRPIRRGKPYARRLGGGLKLDGEVSPCVFMYPGYPLQVTVTLRRSSGESLGVAYAVDRSKTADTATEADVRQLLAAVRIIPCRRCAAPAFDSQTIDTNRAGLCDPCFMHELEAQWARAEEAERQELAARDRCVKGEGMRYRVSAWVHPEDGGDDELVHWYFAAAPTRKQIRTLLREEGSSILYDYQMVTL